MNLAVRRIIMNDYPNRNDINWVIFEQGNIGKPIAIVTDWAMRQFMQSVKEQIEANDELPNQNT